MSDLKLQNPKLDSKLNRVDGQIKAIRRMLEGERDCMEVVTQIAAVRSALGGIAKDLLTAEASMCAKSPNNSKEFDKLLKTLFDVS